MDSKRYTTAVRTDQEWTTTYWPLRVEQHRNFYHYLMTSYQSQIIQNPNVVETERLWEIWAAVEDREVVA
jgi:hypothetical protein